MIPFKNYVWWPEPPSNMAATVNKKRKFDKNFNKKILKNPEKGQLLSDVRKMIHLWLPFRTMVDNLSHHQTCLPPLLKMEQLTPTKWNSCRVPIATKLEGINTVVILFKYYGKWFELPSNMATSVTKNRKFEQNHKANLKNSVLC